MSTHVSTAPGAEIANNHHEHNVAPVMEYVKAYFGLLGLMVLTILASQHDFGTMNNVIAMVIAMVKAVIVVLVFMQVKSGTKLVWLWAALGFIWFLLLFGILGDYQTRDWVRSPGWENPAPSSNTLQQEK